MLAKQEEELRKKYTIKKGKKAKGLFVIDRLVDGVPYIQISGKY